MQVRVVLHDYTRRQGEEAPRGYGYAWRCWEWRASIWYPIPFNWILRGVRELYWRLVGGYQGQIEAAYAAGCRETQKSDKQQIAHLIQRLHKLEGKYGSVLSESD